MLILGDIAFKRIEGYKSVVTNAVWVLNLVIDNFLYVAFDTLRLY